MYANIIMKTISNITYLAIISILQRLYLLCVHVYNYTWVIFFELSITVLYYTFLLNTCHDYIVCLFMYRDQETEAATWEGPSPS